MEAIPLALTATRQDILPIALHEEEDDVLANASHAVRSDLELNRYNYRYNYDEMSHLDPVSSSKAIIISLLIATLTTLFVVTTLKRGLCYGFAVFIAIFLIMLIVFGTRYLRNLSFFIIVAIFVVVIVTVFAFVTYKALGCHD